MDEIVTNSPEGVHQDGCEYIVSALVIDRFNVTGGESRVYCSNQEKMILSHVLNEGEGLLHADKHSSLWHEVTPISLYDEKKGMVTAIYLGLIFQYHDIKISLGTG